MGRIPAWNGKRWVYEKSVHTMGIEESLRSWLNHPCCQATRSMFHSRMSKCGDPVFSLFWRGKRRGSRFEKPVPPERGYIKKSKRAHWIKSHNAWQPSIRHDGCLSEIYLMPCSREDFALEVVDMVALTVRGVETNLIYPGKIAMYLDMIKEYDMLEYNYYSSCRPGYKIERKLNLPVGQL